jgi:hypothetical protein
MLLEAVSTSWNPVIGSKEPAYFGFETVLMMFEPPFALSEERRRAERRWPSVSSSPQRTANVIRSGRSMPR